MIDPRDIIESYVIVFSSTNFAIRLYKILKDKRYDILMQPTPCTISAGCARSIFFKEKDLESILQEIEISMIPVKAIYKKVFNYNSGRYRYVLTNIDIN